MTLPRPVDVEKLPKRFRDYINALEYEVRNLTRDIETQQPSEMALVLSAGRDDTFRYFPPRATVRAWIGEDPYDYVDLRVREGSGLTKRVEIYSGMSDSELAVMGHASNVLHVRLFPKIQRTKPNANRKK